MFSKILRGQLSIIHFVQATPGLRASEFDSKKVLEGILRKTCESYINHTTTTLIGSIMSFLNSVPPDGAGDYPPFDNPETTLRNSSEDQN